MNDGSAQVHATGAGRRVGPLKQLGTALVFCATALWSANASATSILFIGNSFTYGYGSPVRYFHADSVTDLNREGVGGVPALFKAFTVAAGLDYDVYLETHGDVGLDWHVDNKRAIIGSKPWDSVVMQGYSTLDPRKPGDPARLIGSARRMTELLQKSAPAVDVRLIATWPRADMVYPEKGAWHRKSLHAMALDVQSGNEKAAGAIAAIKGAIPVGAAWMRAIDAGFADAWRRCRRPRADPRMSTSHRTRAPPLLWGRKSAFRSRTWA